jgi:hypothetical protein
MIVASYSFTRDLFLEALGTFAGFADSFERLHSRAFEHFVDGGCGWGEVIRTQQFTLDAACFEAAFT